MPSAKKGKENEKRERDTQKIQIVLMTSQNPKYSPLLHLESAIQSKIR